MQFPAGLPTYLISTKRDSINILSNHLIYIQKAIWFRVKNMEAKLLQIFRKLWLWIASGRENNDYNCPELVLYQHFNTLDVCLI